VVFDVVRRYFEWLGYEVTYVRNITDVDDKIIAAAAEAGTSTAEVVDTANRAFEQAYRALAVAPPTIEPRATEHISEMVEMIGQLVAGGHAYEAGGDVYFAVRSFPEYGKLSGRDVDELRSGERIEPGEHKRDPLDFALWKAAKPGEPSWDSPWGPGRPGWHIECSAMARRYLGVGFDIHAGGNDLVFPHHENEIAQAEAAVEGATFCRYWMHNGLLNLGGEKMSKSTGHIVDLLEAVDRYPPLAVRLFYLRTHYRKPLEFSTEALDDAAASLERLWAFRRRIPVAVEVAPEPAAMERFCAALDNDFEVAGGLAVMFEVVREGNRLLDAAEEAGPWIAAYDVMAGVLGLLEPETSLADLAGRLASLASEVGVSAEPGAATVEALLGRRREAKAEGDWAGADAIRDRLGEFGIVIEDTAHGTRWHRR
jgi:cysteinyl-tRNA synthetase